MIFVSPGPTLLVPEARSGYPGFARFYAGAREAAAGCFERITIIHSLDFVPAFHVMLQRLREKLTTGGRIFIRVPAGAQNPFDLVVADCRAPLKLWTGIIVQEG